MGYGMEKKAAIPGDKAKTIGYLGISTVNFPQSIFV